MFAFRLIAFFSRLERLLSRPKHYLVHRVGVEILSDIELQLLKVFAPHLVRNGKLVAVLSRIISPATPRWGKHVTMST